MTKPSAKKKTVKRRATAKKPAEKSAKATSFGDGSINDEIAAIITAEDLEQHQAETFSKVEEVVDSMLEDKVSAGVQSEIKNLKKDVVDEVMGTIMPLLEALKKIADEAPQFSETENADYTTATSVMDTQVPSLEEMQKAAIETIRTQEKLMAGSTDILKEFEKARKIFSKTRRGGIKRYWLDQLMKNSSGGKGKDDK